MRLREAEKEVLAAAGDWLDGRGHFNDRLASAVRAYRDLKAAGKPKRLCFCGRTVSVEGDHLRYHMQPKTGMPGMKRTCGHAPLLTDPLLQLPTAQPRRGGNKER